MLYLFGQCVAEQMAVSIIDNFEPIDIGDCQPREGIRFDRSARVSLMILKKIFKSVVEGLAI